MLPWSLNYLWIAEAEKGCGTKELQTQLPDWWSLLKNISPTRSRAGTPLISSYASWTLDELRPRFPDRVLRSSNVISTPRNHTDEVQRIQNDDLRTEHILTSDLFDPSRSRISLPMISRAHVDAGKLVMRPSSSSGGISRCPYPDEQPLTVSGLLHSPGLGKYAIHFQAEEGPRKKILLVVLTLIKQSTAQAHCNYVLLTRIIFHGFQR
ncbi:Uncharacterized protein Adt_25561 [Abeliophyllum distichum]|uniref:Uncharacterized protein n=1 Tax=Abeliophyllum distichum TaxID=126358 RepID=A0ABD1SHP3_9LAMI